MVITYHNVVNGYAKAMSYFDEMEIAKKNHEDLTERKAKLQDELSSIDKEIRKAYNDYTAAMLKLGPVVNVS